MNKHKDNITPYLSIRNRLSTFTIINCEHKNLFYRWIGHTAVVYKSRETGQLMVLESNVLNRITCKSGVQLTPMGLWLNKYPGKVFVRIPDIHQENWKPDPMVTNIHDYRYYCQLKAEMFVKKYLDSSYPDIRTWSGKMKLVFASLDLKIFGKDLFTYEGDDKGIFCTMLVIMFLQYCGLLSEDIIAQEWQPDDVRKKWSMDMWLQNCEYDSEERIK